MTGQKFSEAVRQAAIARATRAGITFCEGCQTIGYGDLRVDHIIARGLGGKGTLDNAQVLFPCCWREKDAADNMKVKYARRVNERHEGLRKPKGTIKSRGFRPPDPRPSRCGPTSKTIPRRFT